MAQHQVVDSAAWRDARLALLQREKDFTRLRDELSAARRAMPWEEVTKSYVFDAEKGKTSLAGLFEGRRQLIVQHLMFAPGWDVPCKSCSFWADSYNGIDVHLAQRDVTFVAVSRAPLAALLAFRARMGWSFEWVSSGGSTFDADYHAAFTPGAPGEYNYRPFNGTATDMPAISVFARDEAGKVFHTYSCYSRGIDIMNAAYNYLDITPEGRNETTSHPMEWVRLHDQYET